MIRLGVNVDHVATVRQARGITEPDPVTAALKAELAGADGITVHLREDRRHIQDRDVSVLRSVVKTHLNLEMATADEVMHRALTIKPDMATLVPERREEVTTEGGLDVLAHYENLHTCIGQLQQADILVSLFIDPDPEQIKAAAKLKADYIEIHTGRYADAPDIGSETKELAQIEEMAKLASKLGLGVNAGHGLNYRNVSQIAAIPEVEELNIGHSIIGRAIMVGVEEAVREMKRLMVGARE
jgi:pyridoxine 5-phosphate synthase